MSECGYNNVPIFAQKFQNKNKKGLKNEFLIDMIKTKKLIIFGLLNFNISRKWLKNQSSRQ